MAKKKATHEEKPPQQEERTHQTPSMDDASEKLERLKSLNSILLKETVEHRQQVGSLLQSKGALESELTRSEMQKEALRVELTQLQERTLQLEVERSVVSVYVGVQVGQQAEMVEKERDGLGREKSEIEKRLLNLGREMGEVVREKSEIEMVMSDRELEIELLGKKLNGLVVELDNERAQSRRVRENWDALKGNLDVQIEETNGLRLSLVEAENRERKIQEEVHKLQTEYDSVTEGKSQTQRRIELMMSEKDAIERSLAVSNQEIEDLKRENAKILREKRGVEDEKKWEVVKKNELQNVVTGLKEMVLSLQKEEERLRVSVADLEKRCVEGLETQKQMVMEIDGLVGAKKEMERSLERLIEEKGLTMKDLDDVLKKLDDQKQKMEEIAEEKMRIEGVKVRQETEIVEMQKEMSHLRDSISALEESCRDQLEKNGQLQSEVNRYKDSFNLATIERDEARKEFDEEKERGISLRARVLEMEKNLAKTHKLVREMKVENANLVDEKKGLESRCTLMDSEIASLEDRLSKAQKELDGTQAKLISADADAELALSLLRKTASLVCLSKERGVEGKNVAVDEQEMGKEIQLYKVELDAIKNSFKKRGSEVEDMKRQLEFLKNSVAEAHKKKSFWTLVSSATTVFAAASVAYAACGR